MMTDNTNSTTLPDGDHSQSSEEDVADGESNIPQDCTVMCYIVNIENPINFDIAFIGQPSTYVDDYIEASRDIKNRESVYCHNGKMEPIKKSFSYRHVDSSTGSMLKETTSVCYHARLKGVIFKKIYSNPSYRPVFPKAELPRYYTHPVPHKRAWNLRDTSHYERNNSFKSTGTYASRNNEKGEYAPDHTRYRFTRKPTKYDVSTSISSGTCADSAPTEQKRATPPKWFMTKWTNRTHGWFLCKIDKVDEYQRLLIDLYDPVTGESVSEHALRHYPEYFDVYKSKYSTHGRYSNNMCRS